MFKKKDHAMLEEAYAKVMMNEINSEMPMEDEPEGKNYDVEIINHFLEDISDAVKTGDIEKAKSLIEILNIKMNGENNSNSNDDLDLDEEPQSTGGNEGTGKYISKKQKSADHKTDFYINRMNLKPGKDF
jgi:hypothetical protein